MSRVLFPAGEGHTAHERVEKTLVQDSEGSDWHANLIDGIARQVDEL